MLISSTALCLSCNKNNTDVTKKEPVAIVETFAGAEEGNVDGTLKEARFRFPSGVNLSPSGALYVIDQERTVVRKISNDGKVTTVFGPAGRTLDALAIAPNGTVYIATNAHVGILHESDRTLEVIADGRSQTKYFLDIQSMAVSSDGNINAFESSNGRLLKITPTGEVTIVSSNQNGFKDGPLAVAQFDHPRSFCIADDGYWYVSDYFNVKVRKISPDNIVTTFAGSTFGHSDGPATTAQFMQPEGIAITKEGIIYLVESHSIRKITKTGDVSTIAGGTLSGYLDGVVGQFANPFGLALGTDGSLYIADWGNHRIRRITFR